MVEEVFKKNNIKLTKQRKEVYELLKEPQTVKDIINKKININPSTIYRIIEIFLRILAYIKYNIGLKDVAALIGKYFPESILNIIDKYTGNWGIFNDIFRWCFVFIMMIFLTYIIKIFLNKKKI